jgi:hypothetical protein
MKTGNDSFVQIEVLTTEDLISYLQSLEAVANSLKLFVFIHFYRTERLAETQSGAVLTAVLPLPTGYGWAHLRFNCPNGSDSQLRALKELIEELGFKVLNGKCYVARVDEVAPRLP